MGSSRKILQNHRQLKLTSFQWIKYMDDGLNFPNYIFGDSENFGRKL